MSLPLLLKQYKNSSFSNQLCQSIQSQPKANIYIKNLNGDLIYFILQGILHKFESHRNHVIICNHLEEAEYAYNTLTNLLPEKSIYFFPASFKNLQKPQNQNYYHLQYRQHCMQFLQDTFPKIIVTYPEAWLEKTDSYETIKNNTLHFSIGQTKDLWDIKQQLELWKFEQVNFVVEAGQFSLRGSILDVYGYDANAFPYRIEWFDDTIKSIRIFNLDSQLSEKEVQSCFIIPNLSLQTTAPKKIFYELLNVNDVLWFKNYFYFSEQLKAAIDICNLKMNHPDKTIVNQIVVQISNLINFTELEHCLSELQYFTKIEIGNTNHFETSNILDYPSEPQVEINRNFNLLIQDLTLRQFKGYKIFIFFEQKKQHERLEQIFFDLNADIIYNPIFHAIHEGFIDHNQKLVCYTEHQFFHRYHKPKIKTQKNLNSALTLKQLTELQPGDYIVHIDYGIGKFSGLQKLEINGKIQEVVRLTYKNNDILYVGVQSLFKISKYSGKDGAVPNIHKLGSPQWQLSKEKTKKQIKVLAFSLIKLYADRRSQKGIGFSKDNYIQAEMEASFLFEETPDQEKAILDVKHDMEQDFPMDRLVCGDVGFGKTEVALRATFKAVLDKKQVAILVPTTILALQHFNTFKDRFKGFALNIDYINRFRTAKDKKQIFEKLKSGKLDVIIGTHAILSKQVQFKDLGLFIVDEEHKFGVSHKEILKTIKVNVDCLTLTATPIPRTLQFSLMGARDLSIINTPPTNRQPIQTEIMYFNDQSVKEKIYFEVNRGGQIFFVQNKIQGMHETFGKLQYLCPDLNIALAHGQMDGSKLEQILVEFIEGKYHVLLSTNIIESGLDISNVNTIFIHNAHHFGLSELHQLRGRVGRSNKKAYCYLVVPSLKLLTEDRKKKLEIIENNSNLGSGFQIAMRDLDMRGAGDILGAEQSGFIQELGFDTYQKILNQTIKEIKQQDFQELFKNEHDTNQEDFSTECSIETDEEVLIPSSYITVESERLQTYSLLNETKDFEGLEQLKNQILDRFGIFPPEVERLWELILIKQIAQNLGIEKIIYKNKQAKCYFVKNPSYFKSDIFNKILQFVHQQFTDIYLKQSGQSFLLFFENLKSFQHLKMMFLKINNVNTP